MTVLLFLAGWLAFGGFILVGGYNWHKQAQHAPRHCAELLRARKKRLIHSRPSTSQVR